MIFLVVNFIISFSLCEVCSCFCVLAGGICVTSSGLSTIGDLFICVLDLTCGGLQYVDV